jgi:hypothetical protein
MEQNDKAFPFTLHEVSLDGICSLFAGVHGYQGPN